MDPIHVHCPFCQARLKLAAPPLGKAIRCPKCGTAFRPQPAPNAGKPPSTPKPPPREG